MTAMKSAEANQSQREPRAYLDGRYAKIGISAVAAAVRYQGEHNDRDEAVTDYTRTFVATND